MRKITCTLLVPVFVLSLLAGCTSSPKAKEETGAFKTQQIQTFVETENTHVLQTLEQDLVGDPVKEKVVLYAEQSKDGMPLSWSLVVNGIEKVKLSPEDGLYSFAEVKFADVDGDQKEEVLLYRQSSGSAGARGLNIYKTTGENWQELFSVNNTTEADDKRFEVKYMGNYYAGFEDKETGLKSTIQLDKARYKGIEHMLQGISTWIDPIVDYSLVDHNGDGVKEIVTIQRVIGVAHADTIGLLKTTYKMERGRYKAVTLTLCDNNDKPLAEVKL
ncbi:hypothetical protein SAMN02745133_00472 [Desulforamulus putei DSM 12395]|uniref:Lipoprotein n=1 Tax=Desulforamulus putei DSM 12395 TaxID=1121429 RepID=A0A1M4TUN4_9FIRM|nr:hypothetical protein [Desulforamulus putei]SHE48153.1 hypothetical protein SAMN02745133_00472 [Desulforamulus putei DSM 12395]